jgi:hypothetical protein
MDFHLDCECGASLRVTESAAGASLPCACGRTLQVPPLSEMRRQAGKPAYQARARLVIERMVADGELPPRTCVACGSTPAGVVDIVTECEKEWTRATGPSRTIGFLFLGLWAFFLREQEERVLAHKVSVWTPLTFCSVCRRGLRSGPLLPLLRILKFVFLAATPLALVWGVAWCALPLAAATLSWWLEGVARNTHQGALKHALQHVPIYGQLLEEYPQAEVVVNA